MDSGKGTSATLGFPHGRSDYEREPAVLLDSVGRGLERFFPESSSAGIGWDRLGSVGHLAPFLAPGDYTEEAATTETSS